MKLKCMVCKSSTKPYFQKKYFESNVNVDLLVNYRKCINCGFVFSETHQNMSEAKWKDLNSKFHHGIEQNAKDRLFNQPPYIDIALALHVLNYSEVIRLESTLDFAAGYGTLAKILQSYFSHNILIYDEYITANDEFQVKNLLSNKYDTVINTAMFEHVVDRASLDRVAELVKKDGVFVIHTFVSETIPMDPEWFYLEPIVHCAFFTNKSMSLLMDQWGFACSIYIPSARIWVLFRNSYGIKKQVEKINNKFQREYIVYTNSFCDFWK